MYQIAKCTEETSEISHLLSGSSVLAYGDSCKEILNSLRNMLLKLYHLGMMLPETFSSYSVYLFILWRSICAWISFKNASFLSFSWRFLDCCNCVPLVRWEIKLLLSNCFFSWLWTVYVSRFMLQVLYARKAVNSLGS